MGCGTRPKSCRFWEHNSIVVSDIIKKHLDIAKSRFPNCHSVQCNMEFLPFRDGSFEYILASHVIEHVGNPKRALFESYRVLRKDCVLILAVPNGRSFIEDFNRFFGKIGGAEYDHLWRFSMKDVENLLANSNFKVKEKSHVRFLRPLIISVLLHLSIIFSSSPNKRTYIFRDSVFSYKERFLVSRILMTIESIDNFITAIFPNLGAEIEIKAVKKAVS